MFYSDIPLFSEKCTKEVSSFANNGIKFLSWRLLYAWKWNKIWIMNSTETAAAPFIANQTSNITEYECEEPYPNQTEILKTVSWWLEGFSQIIIGCLGFAGNAIAIPVLSHRKLSSIFNRILVFLAGILIKDFFFLRCVISSCPALLHLSIGVKLNYSCCKHSFVARSS